MTDTLSYLDDVTLQTPTYVPMANCASPTTAYHGKDVKSGGYPIGAYVCVGLLVVGLIVAIIAFSGLGIANTNKHDMNNFISQWHASESERTNHAELSSRLITINQEEGRGITLCAIQSYHTPSNSLLPPKPLLTETIDEIRETEMKHHSYYHIGIRLYLSVSDGKLTILYNMSSTLMPFSTIRLEELEFDTEKNILGALRSIVLCSNNLDLNAAQRCDDKALITKRKLFELHGEDVVPLSMLEEDLAQATTVDLETINGGNSLRMYNIVFYTQDEKDTQLERKETRILTVEPLQC